MTKQSMSMKCNHRLNLTPSRTADTFCPNRTNSREVAFCGDRYTPVELDVTVEVFRNPQQLTPDGYVLEAGDLLNAVVCATNDRSCEHIAQGIGDRVLSLMGADPWDNGFDRAEVAIKNGPVTITWRAEPKTPPTTAVSPEGANLAVDFAPGETPPFRGGRDSRVPESAFETGLGSVPDSDAPRETWRSETGPNAA